MRKATSSRTATSALLTFFLATGCREKIAPRVGAGDSNVVQEHGVDAAGPATATERVQHVVMAWSDALNRRDVASLEGLYDDQVRYYGRALAKAAVLRAKETALRKTENFRQEIVGPIVIQEEGESFVATFIKRSGPEGNLRDVKAMLTLRRRDAQSPVIAEETDTPTKKKHNLARRACEDTAEQIVNDLPDVKKAVAAAEAAIAASGQENVRFGGIGPNESDDGAFSGEIGIHTDERFESYVSYEVDRNGRLSVNTLDKGTLKISPEALRAVQRACGTTPASK